MYVKKLFSACDDGKSPSCDDGKLVPSCEISSKMYPSTIR